MSVERSQRDEIQARLDGELSEVEAAALLERLEADEELRAVALAFEGLDALLRLPPEPPPPELHGQIVGRVRALRRREALTRRSSLLALVGSAALLGWLYAGAVPAVAGALGAAGAELLEFFAGLVAALPDLSALPDGPDASWMLLLLVPLLFAPNVLAVERRREVSHA